MYRRMACFIAAMIAAVAASAAVCPVGFPTPLAYDRGTTGLRVAVAVGDIDGDGRPDLVSLHRYDSGIRVGTILLNRGREVFEPFPLNVPSADFSVASVLDVNGDGRQDIVLAGLTGIAVLLGRGDGTVGDPISVNMRNVTSIASGDFDEDGKVDLAITQTAPAALTFLRGDGNGNFSVGTSFTLGGPGAAVIANDFDADRHLDLVVADSTGVTPFYGRGDGTFTRGSAVTALPSTGLVSGDVDGDGRPELVAVHLGVHLYVYRPTGTRTFQNVTFSSVARPVSSIALSDMDGDGKLDIVTIGDGDINILRGTGAGLFAFPTPYSGGNPDNGALIDFDGDGRPDVVVADAKSPQISMLRNSAGQLGASRILAWAKDDGGFTVAAADMMDDGVPDLIAADQTTGDVFIYPGEVGGLGQVVVMQLPSTLPSGLAPVSSIKMGDFDGDKHPDAAILSADGKSVFIVFGDKGTFKQVATVTFANPLCCIDVADLNGDGRADLVYAQRQGGMGVLMASGALFAPAVTQSTPPGVTAIAAGDLNGDQLIDVAVAVNDGATINAFKNTGGGNLVFTGDATLSGVSALAIAQVGDGPKLVAVGKSVDVFKSDSGLTLPGRDTYALPSAGKKVLLADFDGDGFSDIAVTASDTVRGQWFLTTFTGKSDGTFSKGTSIRTDTAPTSLVVSDFEHTGAPELAISAGGELLLARNRCETPQVMLAVRPSATVGIQPLTFLAQAVAEPAQPVAFKLMEGDRVITSVAAGETEVGFAELRSTLPAGTHTITAVATFADGSSSSSAPLTVTVRSARGRAVRP